MLSFPTNLCISSLLPGFSAVFMADAGVMQIPKAEVGTSGQQQVEE